MKTIFVERSCFMTIIASAIEVYPHETTGLLIGKISKRKINGRYRNIVVLQTAYPIQTASRRKSGVDPLKNRRAFLRAFNSFIAIPQFYVVGEYHSHPEGSAKLSQDDVEYTSDRLNDIYKQGDLLLEKHRWLEIVVRIDKRENRGEIDSGWSYSDYSKKARCVVKIPPKGKFDLTLGAFWIYRKKQKIVNREIEIYIPWTSSRYWA